MKIVIVDDENLVLQSTKDECEQCSDIQIVGTFQNPYEALDYIILYDVDCVLLDVEMPGISGIELAKRINDLNRNISIIFITGYDSYALNAFKEFALGYLVKTLDSSMLHTLLKRAQALVGERKSDGLLRVSTFGRFTVFINDKPVLFKSTKAKELLAVCIDAAGSTVDMDVVIGKLWPDKPYDDRAKVVYRKAILSLKETLQEYSVCNFFFTARGLCYINKSMCTCDLYDLTDRGDKSAYKGYYMIEYEWAIETNESLRIKYFNMN